MIFHSLVTAVRGWISAECIKNILRLLNLGVIL